jgi:hypothetical protein
MKMRHEDKRLHFVWSFWLLAAARLFWPAPWALAFVLLVGVAKECWDSLYGSGFCLYDLTANILGSSCALLLTSLPENTLFEP